MNAMLSMKVLPLAKELEQLVTAMQEYFSICSWDPSEHYRPTERRFPFRLAEIGFNFSERKQPNILVGNGEALFSYLDSTERPYLVS